MRVGLLYMAFVFLLLLIVSSEQRDKQQTYNDDYSSQLIDINKYNCAVIAVNFSLKNIFSELTSLRPINEKMTEDAYSYKTKLSVSCQYKVRKHVLISIKRKPIGVKLLYTNENDDCHSFVS